MTNPELTDLSNIEFETQPQAAIDNEQVSVLEVGTNLQVLEDLMGQGVDICQKLKHKAGARATF